MERDETKIIKRTDKVISGNAKVKKRSKFAEVFIADDINNVKNYVVMDVLIPALKKAVSDIVTNGIDMILYGSSGHSRRVNSTKSNISYRQYYDRPVTQSRERVSANNSYYDCGFITLESRVDAERILDKLDDIIADYGMVRVADMYDAAGQTYNYIDNDWGWYDIRSARIAAVRDGFRLIMPKAEHLDRR